MRRARDPGPQQCGACLKNYYGSDGDPCPRCGGHGVECIDCGDPLDGLSIDQGFTTCAACAAVRRQVRFDTGGRR